MYQVNSNQKKDEVDILIPDNVDFRTKNIPKLERRLI